MLIALCIAEGITKGSLIRSALMDGDHVAIMLTKGSGSMPPESRWYRDESDAYRLP